MKEMEKILKYSHRLVPIIYILFILITTVYIVSGALPSLSTENPYDTRRSVSIFKENLSIAITDPDSVFSWTIETSPDIGSSSGNNENNGTKTCDIAGLQYETTYAWYVNTTDGVGWTNDSYTFTTKKSWAFDIFEYRRSVLGWHVKGFERYLGAFVMPLIFGFFIGFVHMHNNDLSSTVFMILLTFALYGTANAFVQAAEYSLFFAVLAIIGIAGIVLGLFLKRRN